MHGSWLWFVTVLFVLFARDDVSVLMYYLSVERFYSYCYFAKYFFNFFVRILFFFYRVCTSSMIYNNNNKKKKKKKKMLIEIMTVACRRRLNSTNKR